MSKKNYGFYYALSAAAAVASTVPVEEAAAQTCSCPTSISKTMGSDTLVKVPNTWFYDAELVVDSWAGFMTSTAPSLWLTFQTGPQGISSSALDATLCRQSYTGGSISCATQANSPAVAANTPSILVVPVNGTYGTGNSVWDRYRLRVRAEYAAEFNRPVIPITVAASW